MELELGLALPTVVNVPSKGLGFDLNGDACPTTPAAHKKKRGFTDAFGSDDATIATLPLFLWASTRDNNNDDNSNNNNNNCGIKADYNGGCGGTTPVGWPPVKSAWRNGGAAAKYVKVKMEGVAIGRKVDLSVHGSYAALLDAVDRLFTRNHEEGGNMGLGGDSPPASRRHRTFTYQAGDGDWMLVGDVPWETFVKSVKRLRILSCAE